MTNIDLEQIKKEVSDGVRAVLGDKVHKIILCRSYAPGDFFGGADVNIIVLADIDEDKLRDYEEDINSIASNVGLEYDALVLIFLEDRRLFYSRMGILPINRSIIDEGIEI